MKKHALPVALILSSLVSPAVALAQDELAPKLDDALSVLAACALGLGSQEAMETAILGFGWEKVSDDGTESEYRNPKTPEDIYAILSNDGAMCTLWSDTMSIDDAKMLTQSVLEEVNVDLASVAMYEDEYGCDSLRLPGGSTVQALSIYDETPCESSEGSVIVFTK